MKTVCVIGLRGFPEVQGGVERHCEMLYKGFDADFRFIVFRRRPYVDKKQTVTYPNIRFIDLPSTRLKGFEAAFHSLLATVYTLFLRPDLVHFHNIGPAFFAPLARLAGLRVVLTYHSANYRHRKWGVVARTLLRISEWVALRASHRIIFVNRFLLEEQSERIRRKSCYIPNGVATIPRSTDTDCLADFGLQPDKYLLVVGRITHEKGFDILIRAFLRLKTEHLKLVIVGGVDAEKAYAERLRALADSPNILFTGALFGEPLRQLYSHARLFVLPSREEGFPLTLLEAMNYGLPIVASDLPATRLVSLPADSYFSGEDEGALAECICAKLVDNTSPAYSLGSFRWPDIIQRTASLFREV